MVGSEMHVPYGTSYKMRVRCMFNVEIDKIRGLIANFSNFKTLVFDLLNVGIRSKMSLRSHLG